MYKTIITDEETFNKKVRREKNAILNKLMKENKKMAKKAKQQGIETPELSKKELKKQAEQLKKMREAQIEESSKMHQLQKVMSREELKAYNEAVAEQNKLYWYWRGKRGKDPDDFYVACESENWENNGWYDWKCVEELKTKTKDELEKATDWYWPSCRAKSESLQSTAKGDSKKKSEGKLIF